MLIEKFVKLGLGLSIIAFGGSASAAKLQKPEFRSNFIVLAACPTCEGAPSGTMDNAQPLDDPNAASEGTPLGTLDNSQPLDDPDSAYNTSGKGAPAATVDSAQPPDDGIDRSLGGSMATGDNAQPLPAEQEPVPQVAQPAPGDDLYQNPNCGQ